MAMMIVGLLRFVVLALGPAAALIAAAGYGFYHYAGDFDLGPIAAERATEALNRKVSIRALFVTPGRWIKLDLRDASLENLPGGTKPLMAQIGSVTAEIEAVSLLARPVLVRTLIVDGFSLLLEHTAADEKNWRFGPPREPSATPASRTWFPTLLDARLNGSVSFITGSGAELLTKFDDTRISTDGPDSPVRLTAMGSYNSVPVMLEGDLAPIKVLRDASIPSPAKLRATTGKTSLTFEGTMTEPLDADGVAGKLALNAPTPVDLFAIAGVTSQLSASLRLSGTFDHLDKMWRLSGGAGALGNSVITGATLRLDEAPRGTPDKLSADIAFDKLDLNALQVGAKPGGGGPDADLLLTVDRAPDTLLTAKIAANALTYAPLRATNVLLRAAVTPGRVKADELSMTYLGARVRASGQVDSWRGPRGEEGGQASADVDMAGMEVEALRRALGLRPVPLQGPMDGKIAVVGAGTTLNQAAHYGRISAVVSMNRGAIERDVIEKASIDLRLLFRKAQGMTPISCLVGAVDMRAGLGTVLPLRVRAGEGTITGTGSFDFFRDRLDMVVGSDSKTTNFFALDIPVRVYGTFGDPTIRPASWSAAGRAQLAKGDDVTRLLPALRPFAQRSPCFGRR